MELVDFAPCDHGEDNEFIFVFLKGISPLPVAIPPCRSPGAEPGAERWVHHPDLWGGSSVASARVPWPRSCDRCTGPARSS